MKALFSKYFMLFAILGAITFVVTFEVICHKCTNTPFDSFSMAKGGNQCDMYLIFTGIALAIPLWIYYRFFD